MQKAIEFGSRSIDPFLRSRASRERAEEQTRTRRNRYPDSDSIAGRGFLAPVVINEAQIKLTEDEYQLLRLGPRFIYNDPATAARRRTTELATLKRKIQARFYEKKVSPGRPVDQFIAELDILLQNLHNTSQHPRLNQSNIQNRSSQPQYVLDIPDEVIISSQSQGNQHLKKKKKNYSRSVKRLTHKFRLSNIIIRKTDKSKVFHLGKVNDYENRSKEYMDKTEAYECLSTNNPLPDLILRTNKYLLDLRLAQWITQKQYEQLSIKPDEVELAHLYYLPKAHKTGTPLRPIISGLRHPTIKISKFLDDLLRPLFDQMARATTVTSGYELVVQLQDWSNLNLRQDTVLCTIDVTDLYTMVPQVEGVLALKKMMDYLNLKQIGGLKTETIIRLSRFVIKNNYFSYNGQYYHQIRGGAMGSPLTLTVANCYMFFFERNIGKQIKNSGGLYRRYIDDIFVAINWPDRHLLKQVDRWNTIDSNIQLSANMGSNADFLDLHMANKNGELYTSIYHKPSYEPYYLPFNSVHPLHMKKNIPFTMLLRAIRYCSTFKSFIKERETLRMTLLLNKYPNQFIENQLSCLFQKFQIEQSIDSKNYNSIRKEIFNIDKKQKEKEKVQVNYGTTMFVHFTFCSNMKTFPSKFHLLWRKYFDQSPIEGVIPALGVRNVNNLQRRLVHTK